MLPKALELLAAGAERAAGCWAGLGRGALGVAAAGRVALAAAPALAVAVAGLALPPGKVVALAGRLPAFAPEAAGRFAPLLAPGTAPEPPNTPLSAGETVGPAIFVGQRGKGKTIFLPCSPDAAFMSDFRIPENRNLIRNLIRFLNPELKVKVRAPLNVEIVVNHDEATKRLFVHLICFSAPATSTAAAFPKGKTVLPPMMEEPMTYHAQLTISGQFSKAQALSPETKIAVRGKQVHLETSAVHEVVIVNL